MVILFNPKDTLHNYEFLSINMTSRFEEQWLCTHTEKQESWIKKQENRKAFVKKYTKLKRVHPLWYTKYLWEIRTSL